MNYLPIKTKPRCVLFELNSGLHNGGGFFSVFFFLCNAYLQSKEKGLPFYIVHNNWPYAYTQGWHDYFGTLHCVDTVLHPSIYCAHMKLDTQRDYKVGDYVDCIRELFIPHEYLQKRIDELSVSLGDYTSLFVRRGDKITNNEAKFIDIKSILSCISYSDTTRFFVQTDDYTVVEELRAALPKNEIVTIVPSTKRGSWHSKEFKKYSNVNTLSLEEKSKDVVFDETQEMIIGLMVCARAKECWTDDTSNVGRFLKLYSPLNVKIYPNDYPVDRSIICHPAWTIKDGATL